MLCAALSHAGTHWAARDDSDRSPSCQVINRSSTELPLTVTYDRISLGRLRFWIHMQDAVFSLQQLGEALHMTPGTPCCHPSHDPGGQPCLLPVPRLCLVLGVT